MVLVDGFVLPPLLILVPLILLLVGIVALLFAIEPPVEDRTVVAFAPWMMFGGTLHVLQQQEAFPSILDPLFAAPTVYIVTAIVAGLVWIAASLLFAAGLQPSIARFIGITGTGFFVTFTVFSLFLGWEAGTIEPFWPVIAIVVAGVVAAMAWLGLSLTFTEVAATTSLTGAFVVFSHALDGVSTAVGVDVLGAGERTTLARWVLDAAEMLPTAEMVGVGWLFVLVKLVVAIAVLWLFTDYVREDPRQARLLLGLLAAVGIGPGVHNLLLFTVLTG